MSDREFIAEWIYKFPDRHWVRAGTDADGRVMWRSEPMTVESPPKIGPGDNKETIAAKQAKIDHWRREINRIGPVESKRRWLTNDALDRRDERKRARELEKEAAKKAAQKKEAA